MKEEFFRTYPYKMELHCHTLPVSGCSHIYAPEMVQLYKALGVDTIVLTNHYYQHSYSDPAQERTKEDVVTEYLQGFRELKACADAERCAPYFRGTAMSWWSRISTGSYMTLPAMHDQEDAYYILEL